MSQIIKASSKILCSCLLLFLCVGFTNNAIAEEFDTSAKQQERQRYEKTLIELKTQEDILLKSKTIWQNLFNHRAQEYSEILSRLGAIDQMLGHHKHYNNIHTDYNYVLKLWRSFVEDSFSNISGEIIERKFPELINYDTFSTEQGFTKEEIDYINLLHKKIQTEFLDQTVEFDLAQYKDSKQYTKILLYSGKLRSKLYQNLVKINSESVQQLSNETFADFWREIRIIPLRWSATFYSKILEFGDNLNAGIIGYLFVVKEAMIFIFIVVFIISFFKFFKKLTYKFERIAEQTLKKSYSSKQHWLWQYFFTILHKSIPWFLLLLGVNPLKTILEKTALKELADLVLYLEYYIFYQLILLITKYTITKLKTLKIITLNYTKQLKLLNALSRIYRFIFINIAILHTIHTVVGKAIVYNLYIQIFITLGILYTILIVDQWRLEIFRRSFDTLPINLFNTIRPRFRRFYTPILSFLCLNIIVIDYFWYHLKIFLEQFDFIKRLSAKIFLNKIRKSSTNKTDKILHKLPQSYIQQFYNQDIHNDSINVRPEFIECKHTIEQWLKGKNATHSLAIYGPHGIGKSSFIARLNQQFSASNFKVLSLTTKITSSNVLIDKLKEVLGGKSSTLELLIQEWKQHLDSKIIIFIDDTHHLFLAKSQGFEAIKALMKIINADIENIFWCASFHRYSWSYISRVLNRYQCFDKIIKLEPWSAEDLQKLIINCHKKTDFELSFEDIIFALDKNNLSDNIDNVQKKFFKMLWEQSHGNPAQVTRLWLNSLRYDGEKMLYTTLPPEHSLVNLLDMDDEVQFLCSIIVRHETLSLVQIQEIFDQDNDMLIRVLKICLENNLLFQNHTKDFTLHRDYAVNIIRTLKRKNYVY